MDFTQMITLLETIASFSKLFTGFGDALSGSADILTGSGEMAGGTAELVEALGNNGLLNQFASNFLTGSLGTGSGAGSLTGSLGSGSGSGSLGSLTDAGSALLGGSSGS